MSLIRLIMYFIPLVLTGAINRPVYKIILTQKGYAQFLQYDVETPPLREFTFCIWIKLNEFSQEQSIFTYVTYGNNRVIRLWLDSGGRYMKVSFNGKMSSSYPVDLVKDVWHNICLSYQSDYGAWALYIDSHLISCEASESLNGFVIPPNGSVILGYGTSEHGGSGGLEGEIFGANMILASTIERNYTMKRNPQLRQRNFHKNKVMGDTNIKYIVLGDMQAATIQPNYEPTTLPSSSNTRSFIAIKTPYSNVEHDVGSDLTPTNMKANNVFNGPRTPDLTEHKQIANDDDRINFWHIINKYENTSKFKNTPTINQDQYRRTKNTPAISEYETPPPTTQDFDYTQYATNQVKIKRPIVKPLFDTNESDISQYTRKLIKPNKATIANFELPPPLKHDHKVYGQWISSNFANNVLNYLKNNHINIKSEYKKVPPTIPLFKTSDSFPYASDFKAPKLYTPISLQRRSFLDKQLKIMKRDIHKPQINVKIVQTDIRGPILKSHALTHPRNVDITNAGERKHLREHRFYRNVEDQEIDQITLSDIFKHKPSKFTINKNSVSKEFNRNNNLITILPFLKSNEYFIQDEKENKKNKSDVYTRSLSSSNKWHNVKSYSNDYTPRRINMESSEINSDNDNNFIDVKKKLPSVKIKYIPDNHKFVKTDIDGPILKGRNLASEISNNSDPHSESVSLIKYNHGYLPGHSSRKKNKQDQLTEIPYYNQNNFDHNIKIGNALNERYAIGVNEAQKQRSFIGGNEKVPDIDRYRSDLDNVNNKTPPSLGPKVCKNLELFDRLLYIQADESIDVIRIMSPVKQNNVAIEFILQNYKKCSLENSLIENSQLLYVDWSKTPVRLFGGAYPRKTTDLCGFF